MPAEPRPPKPKLPAALEDPDTFAVVLPYLKRGLTLAVAEDNGADRGELQRPVHRMVQRFVAQSAAYAGDPDPLD